MPPAPHGLKSKPKMWVDCQLALMSKGVPKDLVRKITTLRQMNLWVILVVTREQPWRMVADNFDELYIGTYGGKDVVFKFQGKKYINK